jgi:hypothetical protein
VRKLHHVLSKFYELEISVCVFAAIAPFLLLRAPGFGVLGARIRPRHLQLASYLPCALAARSLAGHLLSISLLVQQKSPAQVSPRQTSGTEHKWVSHFLGRQRQEKRAWAAGKTVRAAAS